jgi:protein O-GlcNAc transferase
VDDPSFTEALGHFHAGRLREAGDLCARLRASDPSHVEAWHLGGVIAERQGDLATATALIQCAVDLCADHAEARRNLGALLARQGRTVEALAQFEAARRLRPDDVATLNDLANARSDSGNPPDAIEAWRASLRRQPGQPAIQFKFAVASQSSGNIEEAAVAYRRCLDLEPGRAEAWLRLGHALSILCRPEEALACYCEAEARGAGERAAVMAAGMLCPMALSLGDLDRRRSTMADGFAGLARRSVKLRDPLAEIGLTNFYLAYHGRDNRALNEAAVRFYLDACPDLAWSAPHLAEQSRPPRPRIGFISSFFHNHSTGKALRGFIEHRDRSCVEAILFRTDGPDDAVAQAMAKAADKVILLPRDLAAARKLIAAERLDFLLYADIAADPLTYFLAFARLARMQAATWGHADTSGIPAIDHYISWREWEPPDGASQYSERLIAMDHPPTCYSAPVRLPSPLRRADLGLPEDVPFYFCPHNVVKFHPAFDDILADLLSRDPSGIIAIPAGHVAAWTDVLKARLAAACGGDFARVRFLPRLPYADYLEALKLADALLDPMHFCGGITSLEALALGCPIVTLPGRFMRGRMTLGFYRRMGHLDLVASDPNDYVAIAIRLANDSTWRERQREKIAQRADVLFDDIGAVREFEALAINLIAAAYLP